VSGDPCMFVAVWPIVQMHEPSALIREARRDLPNLARRHGAVLKGQPQVSIRPGAQVPGSGGAEYVVYATVRAVRREPPLGRGEFAPPPPPLPEPLGVAVEDIEWLIDTDDATWEQLSQRLGLQKDSIRRALDRHGRRDLLERLARREVA
jgi:hypothetical protein